MVLTMTIFLVLIALILTVGLVLAAAMHPVRPPYSHAEVQRRAKKSEAFVIELDRFELHASLVTLLRSIRAVLLVVLVCVLIGALGWAGGILAALLIATTYPSIARLKSVAKGSDALYKKIEPTLLDGAAKFEKLFHMLREPGVHVDELPLRLNSEEELSELINRSHSVVNEHQRKLISAALTFPSKTVDTVMTPRSVIDFIKQGEFLGPLVLDELHALGHSRLPVVADDLDHVVGILHLRDLLSLDVKRSVTSEKAMEPKVFYIREDDTLEHALAAFIRTRHHLFIVINKNRETVGLITLEDVMEAMIGRQIIDEDDIHADLQAVAAQEGRGNNSAPGHVDL